MKTWILVANRSHALLFSRVGEKAELNLVQQYENPGGRAHEGDLVTGSGGYVIQSAAQGQRRETEAQVSATEHEAETFAIFLARHLRNGRTSQEYDDLVLVAGSDFLGKLRNAMDDSTCKLVSDEVVKNLSQRPLAEIEAAVLAQLTR